LKFSTAAFRKVCLPFGIFPVLGLVFGAICLQRVEARTPGKQETAHSDDTSSAHAYLISS